MNKTEMIAAIAKKSELTKIDSEKAYNAFIDTLTEELKKGNKVQLINFGIFDVTERAERQARNPKTGETITVPASKSVKFKAAKTLKDCINS